MWIFQNIMTCKWWGLKCILHNDCGYFKTLWLANDKWGLKCILHNECGYFKTLWLANDKCG